MQQIFVSYKHEDLDFAENVINRVEKAGYSTWIDDELRAGEDWRAMIDIDIRNAFALIVIMTPEAKASGGPIPGCGSCGRTLLVRPSNEFTSIPNRSRGKIVATFRQLPLLNLSATG